MSSRFRWRTAREMAVASLVLAAIGVLSTGEARAGCQHPWVRRAVEPSSLTELRILDHTGGRRDLDRDTPGRPGPSPCARGACSPAPILPVSSSETSPRRAELWGKLDAIHGLLPDPNGFCFADEGCAPPRYRTIPVERPPR